MNPGFMKDIFHLSENKSHRKYNLHIHTRKSTKYGDRSLRVLGAHIWNLLPENIKSTNSIHVFKEFIRKWFGHKCKCYLCT